MEIIMEAVIDTGKLIPLLAIVYFFVGFLEYQYGHRMSHFITHMGIWGPAAGALLGCVPQCGFSVIASALYAKRLISVGTLLAIFVSTSDEAIPVLLSMPNMMNMVGLLIMVKIVIAVIAGTTVDHYVRARSASSQKSGDKADVCYAISVQEHIGCCSHGIYETRSKFKALFIHPLWHTIKISAFLLLLAILMNFVVDRIGEERIGSVLLSGTIFQPVLASFIGVIPSCFPSVLLAELFAKGAISFGAMVGGLCAGAGLGVLVLLKENKDRKDTLRVIALLLGISILSGITIQFLGSIR